MKGYCVSKKNYDSPRPNIPAEIRRAVEVESGHSCAIKECGEHTYLEVHHIDDNRENNVLKNLVLLCDKHHKMAHAGVIDRKSLRAYKELLSGEKGPTELQLLTLLQDILGAEISEQISKTKGSRIGLILNPVTAEELQSFVKQNIISLTPTHSMCSMGCNNSIGGHLEELKRPYGIGNGFVLNYLGES